MRVNIKQLSAACTAGHKTSYKRASMLCGTGRDRMMTPKEVIGIPQGDPMAAYFGVKSKDPTRWGTWLTVPFSIGGHNFNLCEPVLAAIAAIAPEVDMEYLGLVPRTLVGEPGSRERGAYQEPFMVHALRLTDGRTTWTLYDQSARGD